MVKYHTIVLSILVFIFVMFESPILLLIIGGTLNILLSIVVIYSEYKNNKLQITPVAVLFVYVLLSYGIAALFISFKLMAQNFLQFVNVNVSAEATQKGYLINSFGIFFFHLALQLFRPTVNKVKVIYKHSLYNLILIFFIGTLFLLNPFLSDIFGSFFISSVVWLPVVVILYIVLTDQNSLNVTLKQKKKVVLILTIIIFILQVFSLSKFSILVSLLPLFILFLQQNAKKWKTAFLLIFIMLFYSYFIYPFVTAARQNFVSTLITKNLISELSSSAEVRSYVLEGDYIEKTRELNKDQNSFEAFLFRMFDSVPTGFISDEVEKKGFTYGASMDYVLYGFIPRIFWSEKPISSRGGWFTQYVGVDYESATAMTSYGELYWNFGFIGVALGMFILGSMYAGLWRKAGLYPQHSFLSIWLYFMIIIGVIMHSEAGSEFISLVQYFIIFSFLFFIRKLFFHKNFYSFSEIAKK